MSLCKGNTADYRAGWVAIALPWLFNKSRVAELQKVSDNDVPIYNIGVSNRYSLHHNEYRLVWKYGQYLARGLQFSQAGYSSLIVSDL